MIDENLDFPFDTVILGATVTVERVDMTVSGDIVAICSRGPQKQSVRILDLPFPRPLPDGAEWIEAYRQWSGERGSQR